MCSGSAAQTSFDFNSARTTRFVAMVPARLRRVRFLPGAGPVFTPRLVAAFGERRECYARAGEIQMYSGIAPVTERSGNKCWVHWRLQSPNSYARPSWNSLHSPSRIAIGPRLTISSSVRKAPRTRPLCVHSHTSGSASCIAAGRHAHRTTRPPTSTRLSVAARHCSSEFSDLEVGLDSLPQGVGWAGTP